MEDGLSGFMEGVCLGLWYGVKGVWRLHCLWSTLDVFGVFLKSLGSCCPELVVLLLYEDGAIAVFYSSIPPFSHLEELDLLTTSSNMHL